jgi:hypothetical protein
MSPVDRTLLAGLAVMAAGALLALTGLVAIHRARRSTR